MVRKIIVCVVAMLVVIGANSTTTRAATHTIYDQGNMNTTYITYFKDILSGANFSDNYVAFRSGQYEYTLIVGKLKYADSVISLTEKGKEYVFNQTGNYNSTYTFETNEISNFSVNTGSYIIYSDVGDFPELIERGAKYEMLSVLLLSIMCISVIINRIFYKRPR